MLWWTGNFALHHVFRNIYKFFCSTLRVDSACPRTAKALPRFLTFDILVLVTIWPQFRYQTRDVVRHQPSLRRDKFRFVFILTPDQHLNGRRGIFQSVEDIIQDIRLLNATISASTTLAIQALLPSKMRTTSLAL